MVKRHLPPKLCPPSSSSKAVIANAIKKALRQSKIKSFYTAIPILIASTSTASTVLSSSPAKKKSKPTDCINVEVASVISESAKTDEVEEVASVISGSDKTDKAEEVASMISGSDKTDKAEEVASVISGSAKTDEAEEEGIAFLVIEDFSLDEESKTPPHDPSRLEANRKQIKDLGFMDNISNKNAATLDITCPLPSLIRQ